MKKNRQVSLFDTFKTSNATVTELRVGVFAPIIKISANSLIHKEFVKAGRVRKIVTKWGSVNIKGNILTQTHRDILDAIFSSVSFSEITSKGNIVIFFSGYDVQKVLGKKSLNNNTWLKRKLDEIKTTNIEFIDNEGNSSDFNLTDSGGYSSKRDSFAIVFTEGYMNFFQNEVSVDYKDSMKDLFTIGDPLIKAMIRFFFTHANNTSIEFTNLLEILGYPYLSPASLKKARKAVREHHTELKFFNIFFDEKRKMFSYKKYEGVKHNIPNNRKTIKSKEISEL